MDGFHNNSYMYLNEVHNNEPMTMMGQPGDVSQGQGDLNSRIPSYQLQFNPGMYFLCMTYFDLTCLVHRSGRWYYRCPRH